MMAPDSQSVVPVFGSSTVGTLEGNAGQPNNDCAAIQTAIQLTGHWGSSLYMVWPLSQSACLGILSRMEVPVRPR